MKTIRVGSDMVARKGDVLFVHSSQDMELWKPSRHRKVVVLYDGGRYTVTERHRGVDGRWRYKLEPYPEVLHELPSATIEYGEAFVFQRDETLTALARREARSTRLLFISPLLGFLPSGVKLDLQERYGLDPRTMTHQSLAVEWVIMLACGTWLILGITGAFGGGLYLFFVVAACIADLLIRRSNAMLDTVEQFGFLEWLVRRRLHPARLSGRGNEPIRLPEHDED
jgi:hypothetical protein